MPSIHSLRVLVLVSFVLTFLAREHHLQCIGAAAVAGVLPVLIPWGIVLVMTGQAFITSGVAALVYAEISALQDR